MGKVVPFIGIAHMVKPVVMDYVSKDVKMIKIAHQVNIVLESKCVPKRALRKRVTQMVIAPLDSPVVTARNAQLGQETQLREVKVKVKVVGDL